MEEATHSKIIFIASTPKSIVYPKIILRKLEEGELVFALTVNYQIVYYITFIATRNSQYIFMSVYLVLCFYEFSSPVGAEYIASCMF